LDKYAAEFGSSPEKPQSDGDESDDQGEPNMEFIMPLDNMKSFEAAASFI
jgi:hypothetical protein